jgi:hypothetical protein
VVPLRFETCLIDPSDDDTTYLELRMRDLKLRDEFYAILPLDTVRRFRDQLTEHLDAVPVGCERISSTAADPAGADCAATAGA